MHLDEAPRTLLLWDLSFAPHSQGHPPTNHEKPTQGGHRAKETRATKAKTVDAARKENSPRREESAHCGVWNSTCPVHLVTYSTIKKEISRFESFQSSLLGKTPRDRVMRAPSTSYWIALEIKGRDVNNIYGRFQWSAAMVHCDGPSRL